MAVHVYPLAEEDDHVLDIHTGSCACKPEVYVLCSECDGEEGRMETCPLCGGKGMRPAEHQFDTEFLIIVHNWLHPERHREPQSYPHDRSHAEASQMLRRQLGV
jgi:hypothetical protein